MCLCVVIFFRVPQTESLQFSRWVPLSYCFVCKIIITVPPIWTSRIINQRTEENITRISISPVAVLTDLLNLLPKFCSRIVLLSFTLQIPHRLVLQASIGPLQLLFSSLFTFFWVNLNSSLENFY